MSKFFVQMLLSVMVGVSAALGFNPHIKSDLHHAWQDVGAHLQETTDTVLENASDLKTKVNAAISVKAVSKTSTENSDKVEIKMDSNLKAKTNGGSFLDKLLPDLSVNNSFTNTTQTRVETDPSSLDVSLKDNSKSALNIDLGK